MYWQAEASLRVGYPAQEPYELSKSVLLYIFYGLGHLATQVLLFLEKFLMFSGFKEIKIYGIQRYPLANHFYWLKEGKPDGQHYFNDLNEKDINNQYEIFLNKLDMTDTLIATAKVLK